MKRLSPVHTLTEIRAYHDQLKDSSPQYREDMADFIPLTPDVMEAIIEYIQASEDPRDIFEYRACAARKRLHEIGLLLP